MKLSRMAWSEATELIPITDISTVTTTSSMPACAPVRRIIRKPPK